MDIRVLLFIYSYIYYMKFVYHRKSSEMFRFEQTNSSIACLCLHWLLCYGLSTEQQQQEEKKKK